MNIVNDKDIRIEKLTLGPYETNTYIVVCQETHESLVVDAPARASEIIAAMEGTIPRYILLTHDHFDHTGVMVSLRARLKVPLSCHELDSFQFKTPPEIYLKDKDTLMLGNLKIEVLHTPGHTPGGLCFRIGKYVFVGDTIFPGGPGHTDTPEEFQQILTSITQKILRLPDDTQLLSGHGDSTTVKKAKAEYAVFAAKSHGDNIYGDVTWLG
ncbi:MAG: MBL fold metallo-hydrolase [bacterium]|nr:MBL fold metallo-hydrolase [bacterium]